MTTDIRYAILRKLIHSRDDFVSGGQIAESMGISRVSVKNHVDLLVKEGYTIQAIRNRGYLLKEEPAHFHESGFGIYGETRFNGATLRCHSMVDSTNTEVDRLLNEALEDPILVISGRQKAGRGRRGNVWHSDSGENLYLSLGFRPKIGFQRMGQYTLWMGICLARLLNERLGLSVKVKWPNDLYVSGKKAGGILSEAKIDIDHVKHLIVGLGLNINGSLKSMPETIRECATSLSAEKGQVIPFNAFAAEIAGTMLEQSKRYFDEDLTGHIQKLWKEYDFLNGRRVVAKLGRNKIEGTAEGINRDGHLVLRTSSGQSQTVNSGEVTLGYDPSWKANTLERQP